MTVPLSILDLAEVGEDETVADALASSVGLAQHAERWGYRRVWYAEHHNMATIASAATSVLIAHVAAHTSTIRLGAGGVMLPNHAPLTIAEQFGTLAELHPGRIDLGLGRAPGTDQNTFMALRRDPRASDRFPNDVRELQAFLGDTSLVAGVRATPGAGTHVPLYILGSSLFGAQLAAAFGLPYAFASHFAPDALEAAVATYRERFEPSEACPEPHVIAGMNVIAADTTEEARAQAQASLRRRARMLLVPGRELTDDEVDLLLDSGPGAHVRKMMTYAAVGTGAEVAAELDRFAAHARADELILASPARDVQARLTTFRITAQATGMVHAAA